MTPIQRLTGHLILRQARLIGSKSKSSFLCCCPRLRLRRQRRKDFTPAWGVGVIQLHMTEERLAEDNLGRLLYSIKKTKTANDLLHFLKSRAKNAVIIAKVL